tara:strand:- start:24 stop:194 length:171 start_codon:yes stop_codon:yes gene_type:complete
MNGAGYKPYATCGYALSLGLLRFYGNGAGYKPYATCGYALFLGLLRLELNYPKVQL